MEYIRKLYSVSDNINGAMANTLSDFGFVNEEGKTIANYDFSQKPSTLKLFWKNDTSKQSWIASRSPDSINQPERLYYTYINSYNNSPEWIACGNVTVPREQGLLGPESECYSQGNARKQITLIPLINGGFIWNSMFKGWLNYGTHNPGPYPLRLISNVINANIPGGADDWTYNWTSTTVIGVPPHSNSLQVQNKYLYIAFDYCLSASSDYCPNLLWDFLDKDVIRTRIWGDSTDYKKPNYEPFSQEVPGVYTNLNKNTCVLIKMPRANGYLENVYLMSTAPSNFRSGGIFSFAGRTFINVYSNVVLELPNN